MVSGTNEDNHYLFIQSSYISSFGNKSKDQSEMHFSLKGSDIDIRCSADTFLESITFSVFSDEMYCNDFLCDPYVESALSIIGDTIFLSYADSIQCAVLVNGKGLVQFPYEGEVWYLVE